ncbi:unnamed protein product [Prorocentrum cordatum]|uniref:Uncharacterized protein n=1 Tax=Prorocentrum cordatum TaxID=2364126 RepID=A0ABN9RFY4_9DINO|nr:unnamed protein product [Polarella glacialis]
MGNGLPDAAWQALGKQWSFDLTLTKTRLVKLSSSLRTGSQVAIGKRMGRGARRRKSSKWGARGVETRTYWKLGPPQKLGPPLQSGTPRRAYAVASACGGCWRRRRADERGPSGRAASRLLRARHRRPPPASARAPAPRPRSRRSPLRRAPRDGGAPRALDVCHPLGRPDGPRTPPGRSQGPSLLPGGDGARAAVQAPPNREGRAGRAGRESAALRPAGPGHRDVLKRSGRRRLVASYPPSPPSGTRLPRRRRGSTGQT